jgi:type 1 glutamine amidotransferase
MPAAAILLMALALFGGQDTKPKKIVLIAGPLDTHPKDTHEYERNVILLKHCLMTSPSLKNVRVDVHFNGWPEDPTTLDDADTIFITSRGSDAKKPENHPFYVGDRLALLEKQMARGCGLIQFHWSTFNPVQHHDRVTEWVGGYFDAEGPDGKWVSKLATREWQTTIGTPDHPIARGVRPFIVNEEFYFNLRFRDDDPRLKPILKCSEGTVGYAVERKDGGRGFGFTGGHFYANWWNPDFRKLVLNAIAWTAKIDVPTAGVESTLGDPIRITILTGTHYPAHEWKITTPAFISVVEQDPRVQITVTEDLNDLTKLEKQHALVLNYMNWQKPGLSDEQKQALIRFFERGGGLVVFHGATGVWNSSLCPKDSHWPEFADRITARWWASNSGHDNFGPVHVENVAPDHEITRGLAAFDTQDELYVKLGGQNGVPLVVAHSKVAGGKEPLAWAHTYGKGRVFVTALGHGVVSIRSAGALFRRATAWAAGAPPLAFDPPAAPTGKAIARPGDWAPKAKPQD